MLPFRYHIALVLSAGGRAATVGCCLAKLMSRQIGMAFDAGTHISANIINTSTDGAITAKSWIRGRPLAWWPNNGRLLIQDSDVLASFVEALTTQKESLSMLEAFARDFNSQAPPPPGDEWDILGASLSIRLRELASSNRVRAQEYRLEVDQLILNIGKSVIECVRAAQ